jgi:lipid A 4'-phosphatase
LIFNISYKFIVISIFAGVIFFIFPQIDLYISSLFVKSGKFYLEDNSVVKFIYHFGPVPTILLAVFVCIALVYMIFRKTNTFLGFDKKSYLFAFFCLLIILGILVNNGFKEFSGRARPRNIVEFGGDKKFTRVFVISNQCESNCSFVSGHASSGFIFCVLSLLFKGKKRRYMFLFGIFMGSLLGIIRIIGGGHFLSDVYFSFVIVYFFGLIIHYWMFKDEYEQR